jgi:hypothetical protein
MLCASDDTSNTIQCEHTSVVSPLGIAGNTDIPVSESENYFPLHLDTMNDDKGTIYQTDHIVEPLLISNNHAISISGSDSIECDSTKSDRIVANEGNDTGTNGIYNNCDHSTGEISTSKSENSETNEPRSLSKDESRESIDEWAVDITGYLRCNDDFSRIIDRGWQKSSKPFRGLDNDNDMYILEALIAQVVRFSNGSILGYQTKTCKSLKSLLNNVYRHFNIPVEY